MKKVFVITLIVLALLVVGSGLFMAGQWWAYSRGGFSMMGAYGNDDGFPGPGGMTPYSGVMGGRGGGRMDGGNRNGYGGMMGGRGGNGYGGMMNGQGYNNANVTPLTVDEAKAAAEKYISDLKLAGLQASEVMIFDNNAYVVVTETSTGLGAFELLVDPVSKVAFPEHGPNMMWNAKYSGVNHSAMLNSRGGMMNWFQSNTTPVDVSAEMPITIDQAIKNAQTFLDANYSGYVAADDPIKFYGYYTLDFTKDGKVVGMLSVNGYNGQVFLHMWHGTFIEESEIK